MEFFLCIVIICVLVLSYSCIGKSDNVFDVLDFGAVGDGKTDDSKAFLKAWEKVCSSTTDSPMMLIAEGHTFLVQPLVFEGGCKSAPIIIQLSGDIIAPSSPKEWKSWKNGWISFHDVDKLTIQGPGTIAGRGSSWWQAGKKRPRALYMERCNDFNLSEFKIINSPKMHLVIYHSNGGSISNIVINSPHDSPNTDGINLSSSSDISIENSFIKSGDDCIAINGGCSNITISGIDCGPGHGISVGSLGDGEMDTVKNIHVKNCTLHATSNGLRIKTFETGNGYAKNITFENITFIDSKNPIIINQHYHNTLRKSDDFIEIHDIKFYNVNGTSMSEDAITLDCCSQGCSDIVMKEVSLISSEPGKEVHAFCRNVINGTADSTQPPVPCLEDRKIM